MCNQQISQKKNDKIIQKDVNQKEKLFIKIYGKERWKQLLELAYSTYKDNDKKFVRTDLVLDTGIKINHLLEEQTKKYHKKMTNANAIYSFIYLILKKNHLLDVKDKITKTNIAVYIAELFYRFFYKKSMIKNANYIAHSDKPYITIDLLDIDIGNIEQVKTWASKLSEEEQNAIRVCLKTSIMQRSVSSLFNNFINNKKLIAYRETVATNWDFPIPDNKIELDAGMMQEICKDLQIILVNIAGQK